MVIFFRFLPAEALLPENPMAERSARTLFLGTGNQHKVSEFRLVASPKVLVLPAFSDPSFIPDIRESGTTFFQNALIKSSAAREALKGGQVGIVFSDDSGLVVPALGGDPGVRSSRFAGDEATDEENRALLLKRMKDIPRENRKAFFICVLVAVEILTGRLLAAAQGKVEGHIAKGLMGEGGFGYDPVFIPEGYRVSFGVMSPEEKGRLSHRNRAFQRLCLTLGLP